MRTGSRIVAVMAAAAVWIYAAMSLVPPSAPQAAVPPAVEAAAIAAVSAVD